MEAPSSADARGAGPTSRVLYERGGTIRRVVDDWFRRGHATPRVAMELGNAEATKKLVSAGLGLSVVSEIAARPEAKAGPWT